MLEALISIGFELFEILSKMGTRFISPLRNMDINNYILNIYSLALAWYDLENDGHFSNVTHAQTKMSS